MMVRMMRQMAGQPVERTESPVEELRDIVDTAAAAGSFQSLLAAARVASLVETLKGAGPWTVFAPTDAAFAKLPAGASDDLFRPENRDKLVRLLQYHVVPGRVPASEIARLKPTATVAGVPLPFSIRVRRQTGAQVNGDLQAGSARIVRADIECTNGMIHVIDTVLEPPA
ncbi:MAG: fasciclin domain-containing protein [Bryobacterales bacterium]|nr:fasciclin domain-containing protein [Bryobacterales bacterium]